MAWGGAHFPHHRFRHQEMRKFALPLLAAAPQAGVADVGRSERWKAALAARGQRGLAPMSTRPRRVRRPSYKPSDVRAVVNLRRKHPFMGKAPIQRMLERKGRRLSVATLGRILLRAIAAGRVPRYSRVAVPDAGLPAPRADSARVA